MQRASVLTRATWRNIPEDSILHSQRRENIKYYKVKNAHKYSCTAENLL
jgi:hypothetical protein